MENEIEELRDFILGNTRYSARWHVVTKALDMILRLSKRIEVLETRSRLCERCRSKSGYCPNCNPGDF